MAGACAKERDGKVADRNDRQQKRGTHRIRSAGQRNEKTEELDRTPHAKRGYLKDAVSGTIEHRAEHEQRKQRRRSRPAQRRQQEQE